jgi:hypothetical protein
MYDYMYRPCMTCCIPTCKCEPFFTDETLCVFRIVAVVIFTFFVGIICLIIYFSINEYK